MTAVLRQAGRDDLDAIMAIEIPTFTTDAWSRAQMTAELTSVHTHYLVAERDGGIVAYAGLLAPRRSGQADIQTIAVVDAARREGLGRALMDALITVAIERGARELFLEVRADNPGAEALYDSLGFELLGVRAGYYQPDGVDAHVMKLMLPVHA